MDGREIENKLVRASPEECAKLVKKLVKEKTSSRKAGVKGRRPNG